MQNLYTAEPKAIISLVTADLVHVDIPGKTMEFRSFDYIIYGEGHKMLRRGNFRSPSVQLRTNDLKAGIYDFILLVDGEEYHTTSFIKDNAAA
jgi:hypothetical protein